MNVMYEHNEKIKGKAKEKGKSPYCQPMSFSRILL